MTNDLFEYLQNCSSIYKIAKLKCTSKANTFWNTYTIHCTYNMECILHFKKTAFAFNRKVTVRYIANLKIAILLIYRWKVTTQHELWRKQKFILYLPHRVCDISNRFIYRTECAIYLTDLFTAQSVRYI